MNPWLITIALIVLVDLIGWALTKLERRSDAPEQSVRRGKWS